MGVGDQHHAPAALLHRKDPVLIYRRLGRPQRRSGRLQKISPPPGFDPRTVQPVTSRYTDWAIAAPYLSDKFYSSSRYMAAELFGAAAGSC